MAYARGLGFHVEIVADGELPGQSVVIYHHSYIRQRRLALALNGLVESPTQKARVMLCPRNAVEDCIVGMVLLRDEDDVLYFL